MAQVGGSTGPGAGAVRAAVEHIDGRPVVIARMDASERGRFVDGVGHSPRPLGRPRTSAPLVAPIAPSGADILEGMAALHGWGRPRAMADCSGIVPVIVVLDGPAVSGPALLIGLADFVIMTEEAYAFVSGPSMVAEFTGVAIDNGELGGATIHARHSGAATLVARDRAAADQAVADLSVPAVAHGRGAAYGDDRPAGPAHAGGRRHPAHDGHGQLRRPGRHRGAGGRRALRRAPEPVGTEPRDRPGHGRRPAGRRARQPLAIGTLDIPASQKGARFVAFCDALNLPILTLVDTPGFYPGKDLEWRGMIRHGAQLVFAYGRATVPRVCVILRKSYGGAYIVMDSKRMGNDVCLAWPGAELAVMGAGQASAILQRGATESTGLRSRRTTPSACSTRTSPLSADTSMRSSSRTRPGGRSPAPYDSWPPSGSNCARASTTTRRSRTVRSTR